MSASDHSHVLLSTPAAVRLEPVASFERSLAASLARCRESQTHWWSPPSCRGPVLTRRLPRSDELGRRRPAKCSLPSDEMATLHKGRAVTGV